MGRRKEEIRAKTKDVLLISIIADEDIPRRAKYEVENLVIYFSVASVKSSVGLLLTISERNHLNSEPESEAVTAYEDISRLL